MKGLKLFNYILFSIVGVGVMFVDIERVLSVALGAIIFILTNIEYNTNRGT